MHSKKSCLAVILTTVLIVLLSIQAQAVDSSTRMTLDIPESCVLSVRIEGEGYLEITVGGQTVKVVSPTDLKIDKNREIQIKIFPGEESRLDRITLGQEDLLPRVNDNQLQLSGIQSDQTLEAVFCPLSGGEGSDPVPGTPDTPDVPDVPETGDEAYPFVLLAVCGCCFCVLSALVATHFLKKRARPRG